MSVGYQMNYNVIIKGAWEEFKEIPAIVQTVTDTQDSYNSVDYDRIARWLVEMTKGVLKSKEEPLFLNIEDSDDDCSHGVLEDFLTALDEKLPKLTIVACVIGIDTEYGSGDTVNFLCSPEGSSTLQFANFDGFSGRMDKLPNEDWIPYGWRHQGETPPYAKAEGNIVLMGSWATEETAVVREVLCGGALVESLNFITVQPESGQAPFTRTDSGISFALNGLMNFGDVLQNLELALAPYIQNHVSAYAALCRTMREKKLLLHLELDDYTNPDNAWTYQNHSRWHFLISSDGQHLISKFTWCGTFRFGRGSGDPEQMIYHAVTGKDVGELCNAAKFAVERAIQDFAVEYPLPCLEASEDMEYPACYGYEDEDEDDIGNKPITEYAEAHREALTRLFRQAEQVAEIVTPVRFIPQSFDKRFAGKKFLVKGDLDGYTLEQVQELIEKFGGKVNQNMSKAVDYFIYGSGVGDPFRTGLNHQVTFLSADYFEDMTR